MMQHVPLSPLYSLCCALMLIGALVACAPEPTPVIRPTVTLIPPTVTATSLPTSLPTPTATQMPRIPLVQTPSPTPLSAILETDVTPVAELSGQIINTLADELSVSTGRIQLAQVEADQWLNTTLGCMPGDTRPEGARLKLVDGYRYQLLVGDSVYEFRTVGEERFLRCPDVRRAANELLLAVDPVAADLFRLVQQRVADSLDLSTRRVQLLSIEPVRWQDSSLGCPVEGQAYEPVEIDGYRIVVSVGTNEYIFHSDALAIYPCAVEPDETAENE